MQLNLAFKSSTFILSTLILSTLVSFSLKSYSKSSAPSTSLVANLSEIKWGPPGAGNGFPVGVRTAKQGLDEVSGGITYFALFPAGSHFDLHWHTHDEYAVVVSGSLEIRLGNEIHALEIGSYIVIPGSLEHAWTVPPGGDDAVILVRRAGPADFHFVK
ncbi:MAG: quercetin dioxygenase-like cupin family protein [Pseudohongiellaceae bacterium]|jgi:quercetin dioxygenase-like cupin family protein